MSVKCYHFSILGEVSDKALINDAIDILDSMGLSVGDVVISHRVIEGVYPVPKHDRWL